MKIRDSNEKELQQTIVDITPTILKMVGFKEEEIKKLDMDGRPLW